tara:strand:+ start:38 stop:427 length:390 start_codon:yes stop_codon:yes gene_type:complete
VLAEMELVQVLETPMMVVTEMVEILLSQFLVELLLPKAVVVVLDMVVIHLIYLDLVKLIMLHHKVDLVVEVHGNKQMVLHLTKAHSLVGQNMETLVVTELVVKTILLLVVVELVELVKIQLQLLEVLVV